MHLSNIHVFITSFLNRAMCYFMSESRVQFKNSTTYKFITGKIKLMVGLAGCSNFLIYTWPIVEKKEHKKKNGILIFKHCLLYIHN